MEVQEINRRVHLIYLAIFIICACLILAYSFNHHKRNDSENWKTENYADQGGYFIYNPIWFDYGYESSNFPKGSDGLLGNGFDLTGPIVKNKYTCGVAYLQSPFYLWTKLDAEINNRPVRLNGGQTKRSIDVAGVFYLLMGAICLYFFLVRFYKPFISFISICLVVTGTNVIYYAIYHPGMSHIYSFFLFSTSLLLADTFFKNKKTWVFILLVVATSCIVLIRPINMLFLPGLLFIRGSAKENLLVIIKPKYLSIILLGGLLVFSPQMYYWYQLTGKLIYYSYNEEGFTHLNQPAILANLFAPNNGLIPYSLIFVLLLITNIYAIIKKNRFSLYFLFYQIVMIYLLASWHMPDFGAGYGQRNFVEVFTGYTFILAFFLTHINAAKSKLVLYTTMFFSLLFCFTNLKIMSRYDYAFFGRHNWDWREYRYFLSFKEFTQKENFDNYYKTENIIQQGKNSVLKISSDQEFVRLMLIDCNQLPDYFKNGKISIDVQSSEKDIEFYVSIKMANADSTILNENFLVTTKGVKQNKWKTLSSPVYYFIQINQMDLSEYKILIFVWNRNRKNFLVDNAKINIY